jgi:osmotically-inducible protein OsmY
MGVVDAGTCHAVPLVESVFDSEEGGEFIMARTDAEIHRAVIDELSWDTRVDETDVGVEVDFGVVTLTGTVDSWAKRVAAQEAAHRVWGVFDVANDIRVKAAGAPGRTDTELAQAVRHALEWDAFVPEQRIRTTVSNGWITLEGNVDNWNQLHDCERAIRNLSGVIGVSNNIEVDAPGLSPSEVEEAIEKALERRAEREAKRIQLSVQDGRVTVSGIVGSWAEREAVLGAAKGTPGVRAVDDRLKIRPHAAA